MRKVRFPVVHRMRGFRSLLEALVMGWRVRRIMRTKEVHMRLRQVREFELEMRSHDLDRDLFYGLVMSRNNTVAKLINLISKM